MVGSWLWVLRVVDGAGGCGERWWYSMSLMFVFYFVGERQNCKGGTALMRGGSVIRTLNEEKRKGAT